MGLPIIWPRRDDPRLKVSAVVLMIQLLGQFGLGFKLSIAQILVCIVACGAVEMVVTGIARRQLVWPASAILTGNSTALILRVNGTHPGDWWSLHGIHLLLLACALGLASKYLLKIGIRHLFNPSNFGLVLTLLLIGPFHVFPQYLWWGPNAGASMAAWAVILAGGLWVLAPIGLLPMAAAFLAVFAAGVAVLAGTNHCLLAVWSLDPVCGSAYFTNLALSPETFVFALFMIPDPRTVPSRRLARLLFGVALGLVAVGLVSFQQSEFGAKVAVLACLTILCPLVPLVDRLPGTWRGLEVVGRGLAVAALAGVVAVTVTIEVIAMGGNQTLLLTDLNPAIHGSKNNQ